MIRAGELISRIRTKYESVGTVRWSDADILKAVNEGLDDLSLEAGFYERHVTVPIQEGVRYYDLRGFTPEVVLSITSIYSTQRNDWLAGTTVDELDRFNPMWEQSAGSPMKYFTMGIFWMGIWPVANQDNLDGYMLVYFQGLAPHFVHNQSVLDDLPDEIAPALEDYAMYEMAAQDGLPDRALMYWGQKAEDGKPGTGYVEKRRLLKSRIDGRLSRAGIMRMGEQR